ncbi:MAG TPA: ABC transporter ATP-binding protein [Stellaceae bacterium]
MIEIDRIVKDYGGRRVVDDVSLTVRRGELCVLVGPSGSGKSTLLRMVNRLVPASSGTIRIGGEDVARLPPETLRRRIGYVIQSVGLFPHWTVDDNIATVPRLLGWKPERVRARVAELLDLLRLDADAVRGRYPHQLSGGQQQRVGVARALAAGPELLLMDEPFGALDPITRDTLQDELARIHRATGTTILFVTHDMDEALRLADRIAVLRDGRLAQAGTPADIVERPADAFVHDFIGRSDRGLKLLSIRRVGDVMRTGETAPGEPIDADAPLSEAVSRMVERQTDRLAVRDAHGAPVGAIALADMVSSR